jgi:replicative DNA helicase
VQFIVVDFLQLISSSAFVGNNAAQTGDICKRLQALAKKTRCHMMWVSQLKRADSDYSRTEWRPHLSDFKESSTIEQLVRYAFGVWQDLKSDRNEGQRLAEIHLLKQNFGGLAQFEGTFDTHKQKFVITGYKEPEAKAAATSRTRHPGYTDDRHDEFG